MNISQHQETVKKSPTFSFITIAEKNERWRPRKITHSSKQNRI